MDNSSMHGIPALLSFYFPGLGQLVKGQWRRFTGIWVIGAVIWGLYLAERLVFLPPVPPDEVNAVLVGIHGLATAVVWFWGVVDAYRSPG